MKYTLERMSDGNKAGMEHICGPTNAGYFKKSKLEYRFDPHHNWAINEDKTSFLVYFQDGRPGLNTYIFRFKAHTYLIEVRYKGPVEVRVSEEVNVTDIDAFKEDLMSAFEVYGVDGLDNSLERPYKPNAIQFGGQW